MKMSFIAEISWEMGVWDGLILLIVVLKTACRNIYRFSFQSGKLEHLMKVNFYYGSGRVQGFGLLSISSFSFHVKPATNL